MLTRMAAEIDEIPAVVEGLLADVVAADIRRHRPQFALMAVEGARTTGRHTPAVSIESENVFMRPGR